MSTCEQRHYTKFQVSGGGGGGFQGLPPYETLLPYSGETWARFLIWRFGEFLKIKTHKFELNT